MLSTPLTQEEALLLMHQDAKAKKAMKVMKAIKAMKVKKVMKKAMKAMKKKAVSIIAKGRHAKKMVYHGTRNYVFSCGRCCLCKLVAHNSSYDIPSSQDIEK